MRYIAQLPQLHRHYIDFIDKSLFINEERINEEIINETRIN